MPSVDVIVPCYRYGNYLRECVASVLSQRCDVRVLIIDDCSPDNTPDVARELSEADERVTYKRHETNVGHIGTYNEGIEWASADCVLLLSADDYLLPGSLQRGAELLMQNAEMTFVFGNAVQLSQSGERKPIRPLGFSRHAAREQVVLPGREFVQLSRSQNIVPTPTMLVRTKSQRRAGLYRHELPHTADMEMCWRLASLGAVGFLNADQAVYRVHTTNMSRTYQVDGWLPDLRQRQAAIRSLFDADGESVWHDDDLRHQALVALSRDAVGFASVAFNDGHPDVSGELMAFATAVNARVWATAPWARLALKRAIGIRAWRTVKGVLG